jgi:hypothetical protein
MQFSSGPKQTPTAVSTEVLTPSVGHNGRSYVRLPMHNMADVES